MKGKGLEGRSTEDARHGRLSNKTPRLVGESRVEAAHLAERELCAQVSETYAHELIEIPPAKRPSLMEALYEVAERIRNREPLNLAE